MNALHHSLDALEVQHVRKLASMLEPDRLFEPKLRADRALLSSKAGRTALRQIGAHVAIWFDHWLERNPVPLDGATRAYVSRCAEGRVSVEQLGLMRALVRLHVAHAFQD